MTVKRMENVGIVVEDLDAPAIASDHRTLGRT
jgi:hypothetical protein